MVKLEGGLSFWRGDQPVAGGASTQLSGRHPKGDDEHGLTGFISNLDSHLGQGSGRKVVPEVAKIAGDSHGLISGLMNVGQVRTHMISVKTVAVMDMKIVPGHSF
jgi:hypothetical protein